MKYIIIILFSTGLFFFSAACSDDNGDDPKPGYHVKFLIGSDEYDFTSTQGFYGGETVWYSSWTNEQTGCTGMDIRLPSTAANETTLDKDDIISNFAVTYYVFHDDSCTSANADIYQVNSAGTLSLTIDSWEGDGGTGSGTFSGTLINSNNPAENVLISDGEFTAAINFSTVK